ncbi:nucleomorphin-like [Penaeus indicus]|uniref:nucleomorphin-like n=1 Tax=Penaeus indicus TaxID=29960 RepID=UPI00300D49F1
MCGSVVFLVAMVASVGASRGSLMEDTKEVAYRALAYDLEVLLQQHLNNWKFLTETSSTIDMGEVFDKKRFLNPKNVQNTSRKANDAKWLNRDPIQVKCDKIFCSEVKMDNIKAKQGKDEDDSKIPERKNPYFLQKEIQAPPSHNRNGTADADGTLAIQENKEEVEEKDERSPHGHERKQRNIPVMYMPGKKTKRKCVAAGGIMSGHNAFSFLSFVTGVLSLVLNVNNNINNNNDNNNLNDNNAISNNNVDANANTQNANQIVVFPPGRKRRSLSDWRILQLLGHRPGKREEDDVDFKQRATQCSKELNHHVTDAMTASLRLLAASTIENLANSLSKSQELAFDDSWRILSREIQQVRARGGSGALLASAVRAISRG